MTTLSRVLEPEVMDTAQEASDYDAMDHAAVNARFCDDLLSEGILGPSVLDVGTGTALIPIELCRRAAGVDVVAIDLADHMLALAESNVVAAGLQGRVRLAKIDGKALPFAPGAFAATISNSIVHHVADPRLLLAEMIRVTAPGGLVFVRDLVRPSSEAELARLVSLHSGQPPTSPDGLASFERQRALFAASLRAALTLEEIAALARDLDMTAGAARRTSDRHWTLAFRRAG